MRRGSFDTVSPHVYAAGRVAACVLSAGLQVYSPIAHSHGIAVHGADILGLERVTKWETWRALDFAFLAHCSELWALTPSGWRGSAGMAAEIREARRLGIPVHYCHPETLLLSEAPPDA